MKASHSCFPKKFLEATLGPLPARSRIVLDATVEGQSLLAIDYKYTRRKVLSFVATRGAGVTSNGEPYLQRWADDHGNVITRAIPRLAILSEYFSVSPRVDNHNQSRRHDLALEEHWLTQDCWFRIHTTVQGMVVIDAWKLCKHHVDAHHRLADASIVDFADELAYALITNGLRDMEERSRPSRAIRDPSTPSDLAAAIVAHSPRQHKRA